jgi:hypothetical protein
VRKKAHIKRYCGQVKQQLTDRSEDVFDSVFVDVIISLLADIATAAAPKKYEAHEN